jgi:6-phosphogluconolactonase
MPERRILPDAAALNAELAERIIEAAGAAVSARGRFAFVLAGGDTPRRLYEQLAAPAFAERMDWERTLFFWGDERCVPPTHAESNWRMARETLFDHVPVPPANVFRIEGGLEPLDAELAYGETLHGFFGNEAPAFDFVLLGLGTDGHTASLFPDTAALDETQRWVMAHYVEVVGGWRITLTLPVFNAAREIAFLVTGAHKAGIVARVAAAPPPTPLLPAQRVQPRAGKLTWWLDAAAASALD